MVLILILPKKISKKRIDRIKNPRKRLLYLFSLYSDSDTYKDNQHLLGGLLDMIGGLEYHYNKHSKFEARANKDQPYGDAAHEAIAYLNRLGQIYFFFESGWFAKYVDNKERTKITPTILALVLIRNKCAAHRQQDAPRNNDCNSLGFHMFGLRPELSGKLNLEGVDMEEAAKKGAEYFHKFTRSITSNYKICYSYPTNQRRLPAGSPAVGGAEYLGDHNNIVIFRPTDQHLIILEEIFRLVELFLQSKET